MGGFRDFLRMILGWWSSPLGGEVCADADLSPSIECDADLDLRVTADADLLPLVGFDADLDLRVAATANLAERVSAESALGGCD
jgi:hypothetical protein